MNIDSQCWWKEGDNPVQHLHISADIPYGETVSGEQDMLVTLKMFQMPNTMMINTLNVMGQDPRLKLKPLKMLGEPIGLSTWTVKQHINWNLIKRSGPQRIAMQIMAKDPADNIPRVLQPLARIKYPAIVDNANPPKTKKIKNLICQGWIAKHPSGYSNVTVNQWPTSPVSKDFIASVTFQSSNKAAPISAYVAMDPNFHAGNAGTPIFERMSSAKIKKAKITIPVSSLTSGLHKVFFRTMSFSERNGRPVELAGVMVLPLMVV